MMDINICEDFTQAFRISKPVENDTNLPHPKFSKLCPKARLYSREFGIENLQERRRNEHMENIRKKRDNLLANLRRLVDITEDRPSSPISPSSPPSSPMENNLFFGPELDVNNVEMTPVSASRSSSKHSKKTYRKKNQNSFEKLIGKPLMLSEWLVDVPEDFYNEWFMVCCPNGRRCIIIAAKGETKVYNRHGRLMTHFQSHLPAGSKKTVQKSRKSTILDCIYVEQTHRFYILDVISWNGCTFFDCDTEFRFFWLKMKFEEEVRKEQEKSFGPFNSLNNLSYIFNESAMDFEISNEDSTNTLNNDSNSSSGNSSLILPSSSGLNLSGSSVSKLYSFEPLQYCDCTLENVTKVLNSDENSKSQIDGVMFFNKHSPYTPGMTPLVCWLKVSMLRDILKL